MSIRYVDDILRLTPSDTEQVIIEPDGKWSHPNLEDIEKAGKATSATEDDDLIEIKEPGISPIKQESFSAVNLTLQQTPLKSREPSATSSAVPPSMNKRPAAQVIDLTGSDDDDDGDDLPVRPTKRPALGEMGRSSLRPEYHDSYTGGFAGETNLTLSARLSPGLPGQAGDFQSSTY